MIFVLAVYKINFAYLEWSREDCGLFGNYYEGCTDEMSKTGKYDDYSKSWLLPTYIIGIYAVTQTIRSIYDLIIMKIRLLKSTDVRFMLCFLY